MPHEQSALPSDPCEGSLYFPSAFVSPEGASILGALACSALAVRAYQLDEPFFEAGTKPIAVVAAIANELQSKRKVHLSAVQRGFEQFHFGGRCAGKFACHRNTLAVDHHHPLCSLSFLGGSDSVAPFFAGAKEPSANASLQSNALWWSNRSTNDRHIFSQIPSSSQRLSRRQHVDGCGNRSGRSRQRAPVRSIHNIASNTSLSSARGRPILGRSGRYQRSSVHNSSEHRRSFIANHFDSFNHLVQDFCNQF